MMRGPEQGNQPAPGLSNQKGDYVNHYTLVGIDPGLVHTGCVALTLDHTARTLVRRHSVVDGDDTAQVRAFLDGLPTGPTFTTIEQYRDRGTVFTTHGRMREFEHELKKALPDSQLLDNTGVKKIVTVPMMRLFNVWKFPTTNHRDLQAAARIGLYGGIKDLTLNGRLATYVMENLDGQSWQNQ